MTQFKIIQKSLQTPTRSSLNNLHCYPINAINNMPSPTNRLPLTHSQNNFAIGRGRIGERSAIDKNEGQAQKTKEEERKFRKQRGEARGEAISRCERLRCFDDALY